MLSLFIRILAAEPGAAADMRREIDVDGIDRHYVVHLPSGYQDARPMPLVIFLHGAGGDAETAARQSGFSDEADRETFIATYPEGTDRFRPLMALFGRPGFLTWNAGECCGYAMEHQIDDVGFLRRVLAAVEREYRIEERRVFVAGMSNGGMMAYRLACEESKTIAAVGVVSGVLMFQPCTPSEPVSVIDFHGTDDQYVPINGGIGRKSMAQMVYPPVRDTISFWAGVDQCQSRLQVSQAPASIFELEYGRCKADTAVIYYVLEGGGHAWPGGQRIFFLLDPPSTAISATPLMWQFFVAHPRP